MTEQASAIWSRYRELPRAIQWLGIAVGLVLGFLVWDETVGTLSKDWTENAETILSDVAEVRKASVITRTLEAESMKRTIHSVGQVEIPGGDDSGANDLNDLVNRILRDYDVDNVAFESSPHAKLRRGVLDVVTGGSKRIATIRGELSFEAKPDTVISIIGALENDPAVEHINMVRMNKKGSKLKVTLQLLTWVLGQESQTRRSL